MKTLSPCLKILLSLLLLTFLAVFPVAAEEQKHEQMSPQDQRVLDAFRAAGKVAIVGPQSVPLARQAVLALPKGYFFIPPKEGSLLMEALGNRTSQEFSGIVLGQDDGLDWIVEIEYVESGYIRDSDAKNNWKADDLLQQLKTNTEESNKQRLENGFPAIDVLGWVKPPIYDSATHRLVWSMLAKDRDAKAGDQIVNYNTYALGREGYFNLTLITSAATITKDQQHAEKLLAALQYNQGKRYQDFTEGTDRVAAYGLAALVAGVAAKKVGLFAMLGIALKKGATIIALVAVAIFAKFRNFFFRKKPSS